MVLVVVPGAVCFHRVSDAKIGRAWSSSPGRTASSADLSTQPMASIKPLGPRRAWSCVVVPHVSRGNIPPAGTGAACREGVDGHWTGPNGAPAHFPGRAATAWWYVWMGSASISGGLATFGKHGSACRDCLWRVRNARLLHPGAHCHWVDDWGLRRIHGVQCSGCGVTAGVCFWHGLGGGCS